MSFPFIDKTSAIQQAVGFMNTSGEIFATYESSSTSAADGFAITSVTALGLSAVSFVYATLNATGTPTTTGATVYATITGGTSITFTIMNTTGVMVTAGAATGLKLSVLAFGTPYYS